MQRATAELNPAGALEFLLAERIVGLAWRLRRFGKIEAGILTWQYHDALVRAASIPKPPDGWKTKEVDDDARSLYETLEHQAAQASGTAIWRDGFSRETNAFAKLSRYEASMTRNLFRTLHELERRQTSRQGKYVPPPLTVDIDVTGPDKLAEG